MNNIYAEADEILRTSNKKAIVSILLSMQGNFFRAREAEDRLAEKDRQLAEARAEIEALKRVNAALNEEIKIQRSYVTGRDSTIERKDKLIEQMRDALKSADAVIDFYEANNEGAGRGIGKMFKAALAAERGE